jgi:tRNA A-37 threonylcarbamoyl transferase component Bud32
LIGAGHTIGSYRILNKIGTGGMGAVFLAEHPLIGKKVALKVIHRELAGNKEVVQRFFQEAKAVSRINNEHIVQIHDFGVTPEGDHFYIMEYLEGKTLAQLIAKERVIDVMRSLHIGAQVASSLAAAHASGVIHRDLKPDNVMLISRLGDPDFVKLLDFGLAKVFASQSAVKTAAGVLLGTPQYMSPEACESRATIDARTDVYALGILLFQMTTGMLPFDGETMGEVLVKQVTQLPPAPRGINPNIPPSVEQIILRCLAKSADSRFPTMNQLREALLDPEAYLMKSPPIAPARSLAPGEAPATAQQVMAYAAQQQKTRLGTGNELPLPAPATTLPGAHAKTMIATEAPRRSTVMPVPDMQQPTAPKMNTMRIATPLGYSSRPPRKVWPIVLVAGLLLGLGGGAFAVAYFGRKGPVASVAEAGTPAGSAAIAVTPVDAGIAVTPVHADAAAVAVTPIDAAQPAHTIDAAQASPPPAGPMATVVIDSAPQGAEVIGPDKKSLGKTPAKLSLPVSQTAQTFELRLPGYRRKTHNLVVTGNTVINIPLEKAPVAVPSGTHRGSGHPHSTGDELERPE